MGDRITTALKQLQLFFGERDSRQVFVAAGILFCLLLGVIAVVRAEIPKQVTERVRYESPVQIDSPYDREAVRHHSSEFNGFLKQAWGTIFEYMDPYRPEEIHVRAYPPFFNVFFLPFALPWKLTGLGSALFVLCSLVLGGVGVWSLCGFETDAKKRFGLFALLAMMALPLGLNVLARCETDLFILGPVAVGLAWLSRGKRPFWAGCLFGFAAALKVLPALFGIYLLCRKRWSALGGMIATGLLCTILLPVLVFGPGRALDLHLSWYRNVVAPYHTEGAEAVVGDPARESNQSLAAAAQRYLRPIAMQPRGYDSTYRMNIAELSPGAVRDVVKFVQVGIALLLLLTWVRVRNPQRSVPTEAALCGLVAPGILLLSDVSLTTHHVLLVLPLGALLARMLVWGDEYAGRMSWVIVVYLLGLFGVAVPFLKMLTPMLPVTLALLLACILVVWRDHRRSLTQTTDADADTVAPPST